DRLHSPKGVDSRGQRRLDADLNRRGWRFLPAVPQPGGQPADLRWLAQWRTAALPEAVQAASLAANVPKNNRENAKRCRSCLSAAFARSVADGRRLDYRRAFIIPSLTDVAVDAAVIVRIGPDRAAKTADRGADRRPLQHTEAADKRTRASAESCASRS